jgi:hypothetical protein
MRLTEEEIRSLQEPYIPQPPPDSRRTVGTDSDTAAATTTNCSRHVPRWRRLIRSW